MKFAFTFLATFFLLEATPVMGAGVDMGKVAMDAKDLEQLESAAKRVLSKNQRTRNLSKKSSGKNDIVSSLPLVLQHDDLIVKSLILKFFFLHSLGLCRKRRLSKA
jgi:hypothetical protein